MKIYCIENKINNKKYIGLTTTDLKTRFNQHCQPSHKLTISNAIRKHGKENFTIRELDSASTIDELNKLEQKWIKNYDTYNNGYNETKGGHGLTGKKLTKEHKDKIAKARLRENRSEEEIKGMQERYWSGPLSKQKGKDHPNYGKETPQDVRDKISESNIGREAWNEGKTGIYSEESLEKMSKAKRGKKQSQKTIEKRIKTLKENGFKQTDHQKKITSQTMSKTYEITFPDGHKEIITNMREFGRKHNLINATSNLSGKRGKYKGYKARLITK